MARLRYIILALAIGFILYVLARKLRQSRIKEQLEYETARRNNVRPEDNFNTIFVAIPCYRDEHACAETLFSLYNESSCPWRVRAVVMHHMQPADQQFGMDIASLYEHVTLRHSATSFQSQITIITESMEQAMGPWTARNTILNNCFHNERFVLLVNCHTQFVRDWDNLCLEQYSWALRFSPRPILTTYPVELDLERPLEVLPTYPKLTESAHITAAVFARPPVKPFPTFVMCPSFAFASSRLLTECPPTMAMPHLSNQDGSMLMTARYYTYGWDFMTPTIPLVYRVKTKKIVKPATQHANMQRVRGLLNPRLCRICEEDVDEHDEYTGHPFESWPRDGFFGTMRSLADYTAYSRQAHLGITTEVTAEEQIAKFEKVVF